jgi:hypothetical protein
MKTLNLNMYRVVWNRTSNKAGVHLNLWEHNDTSTIYFEGGNDDHYVLRPL